MPDNFHDVQFPARISLGCKGGPERKTTVVALASGKEQRNSQWAGSRRRYNAGYGVRTLDELNQVISFFEERRGRLTAFRWKDWSDYKSCLPSEDPSATDQPLGVGDGAKTAFQLVKTYGGAFNPYSRDITKPVPGTVRVALGGTEQGGGFTVDHASGLVIFAQAPGFGLNVSAGFEFDVPARFDTDQIDVTMIDHKIGEIPNIPILEVLL
ncbi:DUF2460 domain-containing protein [Roseibium sediminis]|uniref:DUF2460 domain-containing protein n=1 Tax=Roseibium sediminis TaxID=1775174 RepID=UPI00123E2E28|nr:DUF2460 domain-containing protein [Roseibium sediminis]